LSPPSVARQLTERRLESSPDYSQSAWRQATGEPCLAATRGDITAVVANGEIEVAVPVWRRDDLRQLANQVTRPLILTWFRAEGAISAWIVGGLNNKAKLTMRKAYGFWTPKAIEISVSPTWRSTRAGTHPRIPVRRQYPGACGGLRIHRAFPHTPALTVWRANFPKLARISHQLGRASP
jgi:hypothetical protein